MLHMHGAGRSSHMNQIPHLRLVVSNDKPLSSDHAARLKAADEYAISTWPVSNVDHAERTRLQLASQRVHDRR